MKKFKQLFIILVVSISCFLFNAIDVDATIGGGPYIRFDSVNFYDDGASVEGVTFDKNQKILYLNNANVNEVYIGNAGKLDIVLTGTSVIDKYLLVSGSDITIKGSGNLVIKGNDLIDGFSSITFNVVEISGSIDYEKITFAMEGTVTALKGIGGIYDADGVNVLNGPIEFSQGVYYAGDVNQTKTDTLSNGLNVVWVGGSDTTYNERNNVQVIIKGTPPEDLEDSDTTKVLSDGNVEFVSNSSMPNTYRLEILTLDDYLDDDIVTAFDEIFDAYDLKNSKLVHFYDISVYEDDNIIPMENGRFKIRFTLTNDEIKAYDKFKVIYIDDDENSDVVEVFDTKITGNVVEFETSHLSFYGLVGVNDTSVDNPNTNDSILGIIFIMVISLGGIIYFGNALRKNIFTK